MGRWKYILTDRQGIVLGELVNAAERKVALPLNRMPTASFRIPLWHPLATPVMEQDTLLKCYRDNALRFLGPIVAAEETANSDTQTISANAVGGLWFWLKRLIGKSKAGWSLGNATTTYDRAYIAQQAIDLVNAEFYSGISTGTMTSGGEANYGPVQYGPLAALIVELAATLNGYDFEVAPQEPTAGPAGAIMPRIGTFNCAPVLGVNRPDAVFEYGTSKSNVASYARSRDLGGAMTRGYVLAPGWPDGTTQDAIMREDAAAIAARGWLEDLVPDNGVAWDTLRALLVEEHIRVRKQAKQTITITPASNARPEPFTDYNVGDQVRAIAYAKRMLRFNVALRVYGIAFDLDGAGRERIELELVDQGASL